MFHAHNWELYDGSSGVHATALTGPPPAANDPNDIADSDQARYEPQQHAGGRVERKTDAQPQCEDQKGGDEDCRMQDDSQYNHAAMILQQARWYADVSTRSGQSSGLTRLVPHGSAVAPGTVRLPVVFLCRCLQAQRSDSERDTAARQTFRTPRGTGNRTYRRASSSAAASPT